MDFKVEVSFYKLQGLEQEIKDLKARDELLKIGYQAELEGRLALNNLLGAKQDIIDALKDFKTKVQNELIDTNNTIDHLRHGSQQLQEKVQKLEAFINSRGLRTGTSYDIYKLIDDNQKLNQELEKRQTAVDALIVDRQVGYEEQQEIIKKKNVQIDYLNNQVINLKSTLVVEISNVCDLDQEKQDLIEILAEKNNVINCLKTDLRNFQNSKEAFNYIEGVRASYEQKLEEQHQTLTQEFDLLNRVIVEKDTGITSLKAEKVQLENQLAATIASNTSFTLSGDYQATKISKGKSLKSYKEMYPGRQAGFTPQSGANDMEFDQDIDDELDPSIGW
jgi:chromosome segregation ATPase